MRAAPVCAAPPGNCSFFPLFSGQLFKLYLVGWFSCPPPPFFFSYWSFEMHTYLLNLGGMRNRCLLTDHGQKELMDKTYRIQGVTELYMYIYIYICISFSYSFSLWLVTGFWIYFPVLYSRILLSILYLYNNLPLLIPNSNSFPPLPHIPLGNHKSLLYVCESVSVLYIDSFVLHFRFHIWYHMVIFFLWISMIISSCIHVAADGMISFFMAE